MTTVLAALDNSPAARPVLETALGIGALVGATIEAIYVREDGDATPDALTAQQGVALQTVDPPVDDALLLALADPEVIVGVVGARATPGGRRPIGHTALRVLEHTNKPIVVVPPEAVGVSPRPFRKLLLPLEGDEASAQPIGEALSPLLVADDVELVVVHVFTASSAPAVLDHPEWDLPLWGDEFLARFCPGARSIDLRTGAIGVGVTVACEEQAADLIVLSWSQDASAGHAAVIHDVLARSVCPVLLLPIGSPAGPG